MDICILPRITAFFTFFIENQRFLEKLPLAGPHNFYRGGNLSVYDSEVKQSLEQLKRIIDSDKIVDLWGAAIQTYWNKKPVWLHGDLSAGNIILRNNTLVAIIDFGCMAIGDPACDLVIAWNFLDKKSRELFKAHLNLDSDTWLRAKGWALWKALITLASLKDKSSPEAIRQKLVIEIILHEQ
ncbi:phosphotransferase [Candidatus Dependentiae bacterium]|nr:phosphotransferase [Candidatus Dependentiae bacterium]